MTRGRRRGLFLLAALLVLVAAALILEQRPTPTPGRSQPSPLAGASKQDGGIGRRNDGAMAPGKRSGHAVADSVEPPNPVSGRRERRNAARIARRFLAVLIQLERPKTRRRGRALAGLASPSLRRVLLPRPPRGRPPGPTEVRQVRLYGPFAGQVKASASLRHGRATFQLLELTLRRTHAGWRVARIHP